MPDLFVIYMKLICNSTVKKHYLKQISYLIIPVVRKAQNNSMLENPPNLSFNYITFLYM